MSQIRKIAVDAMPSDLDPDCNPIIAEHFFGWERLGDVTAGIIRDLRRRRNTVRLCRECPLAIVEIVDEFGAERSIIAVLRRSGCRYRLCHRRR